MPDSQVQIVKIINPGDSLISYPVGIEYSAIVVQNETLNYWRLPAIGSWITPGSINTVYRFPNRTQIADIISAAPPNATQPVGSKGQLTLTFIQERSQTGSALGGKGSVEDVPPPVSGTGGGGGTPISLFSVVSSQPANGPITDHSGAGSGGDDTIAPFNAIRKFFAVENLDDTEDMWINFGAAASAAPGSFRIVAKGSQTFDGNFVMTDAIHLFAVTAGHPFTAKEG